MMPGCAPGEDPAVLSWRIALAPRPRYSTAGRHWWREAVTDLYRAARDAREALRESGLPAPPSVAGSAGSAVAYYQLSDEEFERCHPAPRFGDYLVELSQGARGPEW